MQLALKNVNQLFNNKQLFDKEVGFTMEQNSAMLVYGGSGSGKTSLFNILSGIVKPTSGELFWGDEQIDSPQKANKIRHNYMAVLFSNFTFIKELSIEENILIASTLTKSANVEKNLKFLKEKLLNFKDIDENIDLETLMKKGSVENLSNGQKEIIAIASVLLIDAKFFLADEMLRSFPQDTKELLFRRLIAYFKEKGIGFFYITHWEGAKELMKELEFSYKLYHIENRLLKEIV